MMKGKQRRQKKISQNKLQVELQLKNTPLVVYSRFYKVNVDEINSQLNLNLISRFFIRDNTGL